MSQIKGQMTREVRRFMNSPTPQVITTSTTQAVSAQNNCPEIMLQVSADSYFREDTAAALTATPVSASNGHFIPAGVSWPLIVDPNNKIGIITLTGTGVAYISAIT